MAPDSYSSNDPYTDQQRTRVVHRDNLAEREQQAPSIGGTQAFANQKKSGLLDDLSLAQIIAGAAAAATSVALASKIGLAGSVIGAAVSSVVTVVSSQLYRRFLTASAQKIKSGLDTNLPASSTGTTGQDGGAPATTVFRGVPARDYPGSVANPTTVVQSGTRIAPKRLQARAEAERAATQRKVIGFSVAAAVVALIACVGIILALTAGEGLGTKTTPIFPPSHSDEAVSADDGTAGGAPASDGTSGDSTDTSDGTTSPSDAGDAASGDESSSNTTGGSGANTGGTSTNSGADGTGQNSGSGNSTGTGGTSTGDTSSGSASDSGTVDTDSGTSATGTQSSGKPGASGSVGGDTGVLEQAAQ